MHYRDTPSKHNQHLVQKPERLSSTFSRTRIPVVSFPYKSIVPIMYLFIYITSKPLGLGFLYSLFFRNCKICRCFVKADQQDAQTNSFKTFFSKLKFRKKKL